MEQGAVAKVGRIDVKLPAVEGVGRLRLEVALKHDSGIPQPHDVIVNDWSPWVFGPEPEQKSAGIAVYAPGELAGKLSDLGVRPMPGKEEMAAAGPAVFVCRALSEEILTAVESGSSAVLLFRSGSDVQPLLPVAQLAYQTGWWWAGDVGTVAYDNPVTGPMTPEGWCDPGWFDLIQGGQAFLLDGLSVKPEVLVRVLTMHRDLQDKVLLCQGKTGDGGLICSGFNLGLKKEGESERPEVRWFLRRLIEQARRLCKTHPEYEKSRPAGEFDVSAVAENLRRRRELQASLPRPEANWLEGFGEIVAYDEAGTYKFLAREPYALLYSAAVGWTGPDFMAHSYRAQGLESRDDHVRLERRLRGVVAADQRAFHALHRRSRSDGRAL